MRELADVSIEELAELLKAEQECYALLQVNELNHGTSALPVEFEQDLCESDQSIAAIEAELHRRDPQTYPPAHTPREATKPIYQIPEVTNPNTKINVIRLMILLVFIMVFCCAMIEVVMGSYGFTFFVLCCC